MAERSAASVDSQETVRLFVLDPRSRPIRLTKPEASNSSKPSPWPPLRWTRTTLTRLAGRFLMQLGSSELLLLGRYCRKHSGSSGIAWGSGCSGSEVPSWVLKALGPALAEHAGCEGNIAFRHAFAAELSEPKREWIARFARPMVLFENIFNLAEGRGVDMLSGQVRAVEPVLLMYCGFSCKTASFLNSRSSRTAVDEDSTYIGQTGITLWALLARVGCQVSAAWLFSGMLVGTPMVHRTTGHRAAVPCRGATVQEIFPHGSR